MKNIVLIIFCMLACVANAQTATETKATWDYPVKTGSEEWRYMPSTVWQEFIRRKDALEVFATYFETRPYKQLLAMSNIEIRNNDLFTLFFLEILVSQTDFANHLDSSRKRKLADIILQSHQSKKNYPDEFYGFSFYCRTLNLFIQ